MQSSSLCSGLLSFFLPNPTFMQSLDGTQYLTHAKHFTSSVLFFSMVGNKKYNTLSFTKEGISWHATEHWTLKNFLLWQAPSSI